MKALFLRHEGFLGAVGAFLKVHPMHVPTSSSVGAAAAAAIAAAAGYGSAAATATGRQPSLKSTSDMNVSTKVGACFDCCC